MKNNTNFDITIIIGQPGPPDLIEIINKIALAEGINYDEAWNLYVKNILLDEKNKEVGSDLLNEIFSLAIGSKVKILKLFFTFMMKGGIKYPGVIIKFSDINGPNPEDTTNKLSDKNTRDLISALMGKGFKSEWVFTSLSSLENT